jgi:hypothetical protein
MIHCTSAARHNKSIVYKIAPKRKQRYYTISKAASLAGLPLMYATQTLLFSAEIITSTTKLFEAMK